MTGHVSADPSPDAATYDPWQRNQTQSARGYEAEVVEIVV
jgi:hypothetical protein